MKTKSLFFSLVLSIVSLCLIVALVVIFNVKQPFVPSESTLNVEDASDWDSLETPATTEGGTVEQSEVETAEGMYYRTLTAVPAEGYTFAYWQNASTKLCGDIQLTLGASSMTILTNVVNACTPVFVANSNVFVISDLATFKSTLVSDINADITSGKIYKLSADIAFFSAGANAITSSLGVFRGVLDGNNHSISGVSLDGVGFFDSIDGGVVKNLILSDGTITGDGSTYVGGFCGSINNGLVSRCLSYLNVRNSAQDGYAGGIVGVCSSTTQKSMLFSCGFYGTVSASNPQQMIAFNTKIQNSTSESCSVFRPKNNGAINAL